MRRLAMDALIGAGAGSAIVLAIGTLMYIPVRAMRGGDRGCPWSVKPSLEPSGEGDKAL